MSANRYHLTEAKPKLEDSNSEAVEDPGKGRSEEKCDCWFCRNSHDFDMPAHLVDSLREENVVVFAGAGISTEGRVLPTTLYGQVAEEIGVDPEDGPPFSELMESYCDRPDGRAELLQKVQKRFRYIESFPELYRHATRFHKELSTLYMIDTIVTTNWDDFFERECGATPFVTPDDFALWSMDGRKVFKIHGSINNLGSIVATSADYQECYDELEEGLIGGSLKMMLATKTILYIGYSFRDEDLLELHSLLREEMGEVFPHAYIVTLDKPNEDRYREQLGLTPIFTDASHFLSVLKAHEVENGCLLPDERIEGVIAKLHELRSAHANLFDHFDIRETPAIIYAGYFQDGMIHAFERMTENFKTGEYSHRCEVVEMIRGYTKGQEKRLENENYGEFSYAHGYTSGLMFLLSGDEERKEFPLYYLFGADEQPSTLEQFDALVNNAHRIHSRSYKEARREVSTLGESVSALHHRPFL